MPHVEQDLFCLRDTQYQLRFFVWVRAAYFLVFYVVFCLFQFLPNVINLVLMYQFECLFGIFGPSFTSKVIINTMI